MFNYRRPNYRPKVNPDYRNLIAPLGQKKEPKLVAQFFMGEGAGTAPVETCFSYSYFNPAGFPQGVFYTDCCTGSQNPLIQPGEYLTFCSSTAPTPGALLELISSGTTTDCSAPCPSPSPTPSATPTQTPTQTPTPTPSVTPTFTPTPSATPVIQFFILAENGDTLQAENGDLLLQEAAP